MTLQNGGGDAVIDLCGQKMSLLPERAAYWHETQTLLIADPHWGKASTFRVSGIPVPSGTTREAVNRMDSLIARTNPERIVFLGDLLHAREGRSAQMFETLAAWRAVHSSIDMLLVRGNHDKRAGDPPAELRMTLVDAPHFADPFVFAHHPTSIEGTYVLAGHVHPGIRLHGKGRQHARLPCFHIGKGCAVLPAFGDFTGLADIEIGESDRVYAVATDSVIEIRAR